MTECSPIVRHKGRAAVTNRCSRFEPTQRTGFDDGWESGCDDSPVRTQVRRERAKTIIARNTSPDISFDRSINPYRGCEHGCIYCFARPTHAQLGHSPGLDFETLLTAKTNSAALLEAALSKPGYKPVTIALGAVTDPYQPIERYERITREILEVLDRFNHPVGIVTKSAGVLRDRDILERMAERNLVKIALSITTLDRSCARTMEPRASTPARRLEAISALSAAGVRTCVMVAPIIPALTDHELEAILGHAAEAGAHEAGYVMLRLPLEIADLFNEWLQEHYPDRAKRIMGHVRDMHGGSVYRSDWFQRQSGRGAYATLIARRFRLACTRLGLARERAALTTSHFAADFAAAVACSQPDLFAFENRV